MAETQSDLVDKINELLKDNEKLENSSNLKMYWCAKGDIAYRSTTRLYSQQFFLYKIV